MELNNPKSSRRIGRGYTIMSLAVGILALAGCMSAPTTPTAPMQPDHHRKMMASPKPVGHWQGLSQAGRHQQVGTELTAAAADATLHYGSPLQCTISAHYVGDSGSERRYDVTSSNGGWCDNALAGSLGMTPASDGSVELRVSDSQEQVLGKGQLPTSE